LLDILCEMLLFLVQVQTSSIPWKWVCCHLIPLMPYTVFENLVLQCLENECVPWFIDGFRVTALLLWGVASSLSLSLSLLVICRWWEFEAGKWKMEEEQDWLLKCCTISLWVMAVRGNVGSSMGICIELPYVHGLWLWSHSGAKIVWTWYKGTCSESRVSVCCNTLFFFFHIICQVTFWEQLLIYDFLFYSLKWSIMV
jgi:hypothetical protein